MHSMLQNLPAELLDATLDHLPSKRDRRSLWAVSRRFRELLASRVFETRTIRAKEHALLRLDSRPYSSLDATHTLGCLKLVKHIHLKAPFHEELDDDRCPHAHLYGLPVDRYTSLQPKGASARVLKLIPLLSQLQENGLISFNWDLGMCVPEHILGREGYLTRKQTAIESLSLITGGRHDWYLGSLAMAPVVLSNFPQLRKFSWKMLRSTQELDSLRGLFASNYRVLQVLELDFISWDDVTIVGVGPPGCMYDPPLHSFTERILPHGLNGRIKTFRSLERLALSAFGFEKVTREITQASTFPVSNR